MNFRYKLMRFMQGRYGIDNLFFVLFALAAVLSLVNSFARSWVLQIIVDAILIYAFYRVLSRNINARSRENRLFDNLKNKIQARRNLNRQRKADWNHVYKKCPQCKAVLRLPRRKGKHSTVCPKCNKEFKVTVR